MAGRSHSSRSSYEAYRAKRKGEPTTVPVELGKRRNTARSRSFIELFFAFWSMLSGHRAMLMAALGSLTIATVLGLAPMYGPKIIVDYALTDRPYPEPWSRWFSLPADRRVLLAWVTFGMVVLSATAVTVGVWGRWHATRMTKRVQVSVRKRVFDHAVHLPLHRVYELKSGGITSLLRDDAGSVGDLIFSMIYNFWRIIIQITGSLFILAITDWRLLLGMLVFLPMLYYTHRMWISRIRPMWRDIRQTRQSVDGTATEAFGGMRVVRGFSRQLSESLHFVRGNNLMARQELFAWWHSRGVEIVWSLLIPIASAVVMWYGGLRIIEGKLTVGDLFLFLTYLLALLNPIASLAGSATSLQNGLAGLDRVLDLLAEPTEMPPRPGAIELDREKVRGRIRLRDVGFAYTDHEVKVLNDIDIEVEPGQVVALVGPSGAGKTTLCNLVARFYDPTEGSIELDGVDLRDIRIESYRRLLGVVEQDIFLFDGSVEQNIGYGRRGATADDVFEAAKQANAHDFILELPDGYDTLIGERGVKLSGGQRQRLAIARAILSDPKILILDEATSSLDTETERQIQLSLQTLMTDRTSFVIAHRLSTIAHADQIVVLEEGRIVEHGRHDELMLQSGRYQRMVAMQTAPAPLVAKAWR